MSFEITYDARVGPVVVRASFDGGDRSKSSIVVVIASAVSITRVRARWVSSIDVVVDDRTSRAPASRLKFSRQSSMGAASLDVARRLRHRSIDRSIDRSIGDVAVARTTSMRDASRVRS